MSSTLANSWIVAVTGLAALAGAIDAALGGEIDLLVIFLIVLGLAVVQYLRLHPHRPPVPVRADLVRWLRSRAEVTDEPIDQITDRAIASYRQGLWGEAASQHAAPPG